jgi:hypothetical protein
VLTEGCISQWQPRRQYPTSHIEGDETPFNQSYQSTA